MTGNFAEFSSNFDSPCNADLFDQWKTANEILSNTKIEITDDLDNIDCDMIMAEEIRVPKSPGKECNGLNDVINYPNNTLTARKQRCDEEQRVAEESREAIFEEATNCLNI